MVAGSSFDRWTIVPDDFFQQSGIEWTAPALADHNSIRCAIS